MCQKHVTCHAHLFMICYVDMYVCQKKTEKKSGQMWLEKRAYILRDLGVTFYAQRIFFNT